MIFNKVGNLSYLTIQCDSQYMAHDNDNLRIHRYCDYWYTICIKTYDILLFLYITTGSIVKCFTSLFKCKTLNKQSNDENVPVILLYQW